MNTLYFIMHFNIVTFIRTIIITKYELNSIMQRQYVYEYCKKLIS